MECKHGCGYEHTHRGAMNIHENIHCPLLKKNPQKTVKKQKTVASDICKNGCEWRLLRESEPIEKEAMDKGYEEVCKHCLELR